MGKRWQISWVLLVSVIVAYLDRVSITYTISQLAIQYQWDKTEMGTYGSFLMSLFYLAYGISNIFISSFAIQRLGGRVSLMFMMTLWAFFTITGAWFSQAFIGLMASRILLGMSEGLHYPTMTTITKRWFPMHERSRGNGIWNAGIFGSLVLGPFLLVPIMEQYGWQAMFYFLAFVGFVVPLPLLYFFVYDSPAHHPTVSAMEKEYITAHQEQDIEEGKWLFLRSKLYWIAVLGGCLNNTVAHGLLNWLPTFFRDEKGLEGTDIAFALSIPYLLAVAGVVFWSYWGDKTNKRLRLSAVGFLGASVFCAMALLLVEDVQWLIGLLGVGIFFFSSYVTAEYTIAQRILPEGSVARGIGLYNGFTIIVGGGLGPLIAGLIGAYFGNFGAGIVSLTLFCVLAALTMLWLERYLKY